MSSQNQLSEQLAYYEHNLEEYEGKGMLGKSANRAFKRKASIIADSLRSNLNTSVLEVGAGSGLLTFFVYDMLNPKKYTALDLSPVMLAKARERMQRNSIEYVVGDATHLNQPDNSYNAIIGTDIIHHLENPVEALKEWNRVTSTGGKLCILESNAYNPLNLRYIGVEHEARSFLNTDTNLKKWMEAAGWVNVKITPAPAFTPAGPSLFVPLFKVIDYVSPKIPVWKKLTALWIVYGEKS